MDIQDLLIYSRVAARQNLSAAAAELGLTPGTISKRLQALEEALGVRLIERSTRSVRITDEGGQFLEHVKTVLSEIDQARSAIAARTGKTIGKLRVAAPNIIGRTQVAASLATFLNTYPEIEVQLDLTDRSVDLYTEDYDIAIVCGKHDAAALTGVLLACDRLVVVASPGYLEARGTPQAPADLTAHRCLASTHASAWTFGRGTDRLDVAISPQLRSDSCEILRIAALDGKGLMWSTEMSIGDDLAAGRLVPVLSQHIDNNETGIFALSANGRHVPPREDAFVSHLTEWFNARRTSLDSALGLNAA